MGKLSRRLNATLNLAGKALESLARDVTGLIAAAVGGFGIFLLTNEGPGAAVQANQIGGIPYALFWMVCIGFVAEACVFARASLHNRIPAKPQIVILAIFGWTIFPNLLRSRIVEGPNPGGPLCFSFTVLMVVTTLGAWQLWKTNLRVVANRAALAIQNNAG